jgi:hypothetical protein
MSASNLVPNALVPNYSFSATASATVANLASSASLKVLVWSGVVSVDATGNTTLTWTYADAADPKLFKAGDYVVAQPIELLATSAVTATLTPAATTTTDTLALTSLPAAAKEIYVEVWRTSA